MEHDSGKSREKILFASLTGFLYILAGSIQFGLSLCKVFNLGPIDSIENSLFGLLFLPSDLMGSLILVLIGSIFLYGLMELRNGLDEGIAYIYVGILISLVFATVYTLVMVSNWMESYLFNDPKMNGWNFGAHLRPAIYLCVLPFWGYLMWKKEFRGMDK